MYYNNMPIAVKNQYIFCELFYNIRIILKYYSVLSAPAALVLAHRTVDFLGTFAIMYLTGQPEGECRSPDPAKANTKLRNSRS